MTHYGLADQLLADVVSANARAASVLDRYGLDYCCHGHDTVTDAARRAGVPLDDVVAALEMAGAPVATVAPLDAGLDTLVDHIVEHHHGYVRAQIPVITAWLDKLVSRHGGRHPELKEIRDTFLALGADLTAHMAKEEHILFPFITDLAVAARAGRPLPRSPFGTLLNPVRVMNQDHRAVCDLVERLRTLSGGYQPPADGCRTYHLCFAELAGFDADLSRHVHIEDHVLFPRALDLELALT